MAQIVDLVADEIVLVAEQKHSLIQGFSNESKYDEDEQSDNSEINSFDVEAVNSFHRKQAQARELYDAYTTEWRRVRCSFIAGEFPVFPAHNHLKYNYQEDMKWYQDQLKYLKSVPDFVPYVEANSRYNAVLCHPYLGPYTGPYRELSKDSMLRALYSRLYENDHQQLEREEREERQRGIQLYRSRFVLCNSIV
jgi:hypothetical protein